MIKQNQKIKIALIGDSLAQGGAEKVHALLSIYFKDSGLEVENCIFTNCVSYKFSGTLLNLGKTSPGSFFIFRKLSQFLVFKKFIKSNNFDFVIDFRMRTNFFWEFLISNTVYSSKIFYTVHSGVLEYYFPKSAFLSNLIYNKKNVVTVSKAIRNEILFKKLANKVDCIYNPVDLRATANLQKQSSFADSDYILAIGRMSTDIKQFDKLILAYTKSNLSDQNIKLVFLGEGENKQKYIHLAEQLGVKDFVIFKGFVENPFPYYKNTLFLVLCSKNEGFPNVIMESLGVGTPVVAFDCFSGPNEIIIDKSNGLLVENQNFEKLTEAMNLFVENNELYDYCKSNSCQSVAPFSLDKIGKQWLDYLKINVS
ncbi:glycosyltransferase [Flavobacterium sp. RSP49]|uniref:glycosyltransferase n=1 Tax=Flavobacterium sp. RSP49 TaxID=2497487 RepID=UPI000F82D1BA|nr:glycosyltransferase [Flavobacterium sp. RSP49]RTY97649.1 glycosyltransferase [Flavobacterium sp. RSP49]